jgi:hypothetical protein
MIDFTIRPDNAEPYTVNATARDLRLWEKAGPGRSMSKLLGDISITSLYELAHIASRRQQLFTGTLAEFEETCELEFEETEAPDPTRPAP